MMDAHKTLTTFGVTLVAAGLACGKGEKPAARETTEVKTAPPTAAPNPALTGGSISGTVKFVGTPPTNPPIDMSEEPKCQAEYTVTPREEIVVVNANGTLSNVFVYVKEGLAKGTQNSPPNTPVVIDQRGCMYHPRVFGIMVGQPLEIKNSDPLLHNIKALGKQNRPFNISQPTQGMATTRTFTTPEVMLRFECNVHGWMHAFAGVLPHPFFSTTGSEGTFTIKALPPGTYKIEAWHEKFGTQSATVTVQGSESKAVDFTFGK